jgi:hypothetical protein
LKSRQLKQSQNKERKITMPKVSKYGAIQLTNSTHDVEVIIDEQIKVIQESDSLSRQQLKLSRNYYNNIVEAENRRRFLIKWGGETSPLPPHEHEKLPSPREECEDRTYNKKDPVCKECEFVKECKQRKAASTCDECEEHWQFWRDRYYSVKPLDLIPYREKAIESGLYWGSYLLVEQAFSAAWKSRDFFSDVKFKSWHSGGVIGVQIQSLQDMNSFFKIEKAFDPREGRRAGQRHTLQIRVGTINDEPVWSDPIKFEMHRPLKGIVTWVMICLSYRGTREIWSVNFTCSNVPARTDDAQEGSVAIDVSWRKMPNGCIRIAYARGSNGNEYEMTMNQRWYERIERADRIRSFRDQRLNELKAQDKRFCLVKKPHRVRAFALKHNIEDIKGGYKYSDKKGHRYENLKGWCDYDLHLDQYELGCRRKSVAARRDAMKVWIRMLRRRYATAIIKDSSHKEMKDRKRAIKDGIRRPARKQGHHAAPGEFIEEICKVFGRDDNVAVVESPGTTATCTECGHLMEVGPELLVTCENMICEQCGAQRDRDRVSTQNLSDRFYAGEYKKPRARKTTARFAKRHKNSNQPEQC